MKLFNQLKTMAEKASVPLPITAEMLKRVIALSNNEVFGLEAHIEQDWIKIKGKFEKKMLVTVNVPFEITLKPKSYEERTVTFEIVEISPLDIGWMNEKIFNNPPYCSYVDRSVKMDFNAWDIVRKVPVGKIKRLEIKDDKLYVSLGI